MAITATTQQSRFHTETLQTLSEDVDLKKLTLTVGDNELLADADLRLFSGVKYGLIGSNGIGKSTLLRAIGAGLVVGFPSNLHALYVDQLASTCAECSVLGLVMDADKDVLLWRQQASLLQGNLDAGDEDGIVQAVKAVKIQDIRAQVAEAALTNELRSGERGKVAQKHLLDLEAKCKAAEDSLQRPATRKERQAGAQLAQEMLESLLQNLDLADAGAAESRARKILRGLGFSKAMQDGPVTRLSGGWRVRAALAQALFIEPDILLLDEPTNFLSLPGIIWLQGYLKSLKDKTVVVISHDRAFLDAIAQEIIVFRNKKLTYHTGNYSEYRSNADDKRLHKLRLQESLQKKKANMEKSIQDNLALARRTGDDKKLRQVASRQKKLDERMGMERNEKGHRLQINRDMAGYSLTMRHDIVVEELDQMPTWKLPEPAPMRTGGPLIQMESVTFAYPPASHAASRDGATGASLSSEHSTKGRAIVKNVTLCIEQGARVALVGENGKGKSTLLKLMLGELSLKSGVITRHPQARVGVFAQNIVEELILTGGDSSALSHMQQLFPAVKEQELRRHLGSFGIKGSLATQRMKQLSGGQAVRVQLAVIAFTAPQLLILDEPTSHLDLLSIDALTTCLQQWNGAVVIVSHDQHFVSSVAKQVYLVDQQTIRLLENGMQEYVNALHKQTMKTPV